MLGIFCKIFLCHKSLTFTHILSYLRYILFKLHKFNNKKWESSFYKLGDPIGAGNFGVVRKATVQVNDKIPPELRQREVRLCKIRNFCVGLKDTKVLLSTNQCFVRVDCLTIFQLSLLFDFS